MEIVRLGLIDYQKAYDLQKNMLEQRISGQAPDTLIFTEHPVVITIGRNGARKNILAPDVQLKEMGVEVIEIERGGDVTVHCPGQMVCYPIVDLKEHKCDLHWYMKVIEQTVIELLAKYGIDSLRKEGFTGVWLAGGEKIASIGVGARSWVTFHGVSLNVNTDMACFSLVRSCGIDGVKMGSMQSVLGKQVDMEEIIDCFSDIFVGLLGKL